MKLHFDVARLPLIKLAQQEERFIINSIQSGTRNYAELREALERYTVLLTAADALFDLEQKGGE